MKITKLDFELFKQYCSEWQKILGLVNWALYFYMEDLEGAYARTYWNVEGTCATIKLTTKWDEGRPFSRNELDNLALHEVLHVLFAPLLNQAEKRYAAQDSLDEAEHSIVRTLQHALYEMHHEV